MAGRYWYLEEEKTPDMAAACEAFERSCGGNPVYLLLGLKFRGDIEPIRDTYAGRTLLELQARAVGYGRTIVFGKTGRERYGYPRSSDASDAGDCPRSCLLALAIAALVALGLMVIGLVSVLQWLF
jgi:hypothetical protein